MATNTTKISQLSQLTSLTDSITWPVVSDGATRRVALSTVRDEIVKPANSTRLGGIKVGNNLSVAPDGTLSATYSYSLPIASDSRLGGIKVGSGLTISPTGTLSTTYELPPATYSTLGGIKVGDNLTIDEDGTLNAVPAPELDGATILTNEPGLLEISSSDFISLSAIGSMNLSSSQGSIYINGITTVFSSQIVAEGGITGNLTGTLTGNVIGGVFEIGYDGSQEPIIDPLNKIAKLNKVQGGNIILGDQIDRAAGTSVNYISNVIDNQDIVIAPRGTGRVKIDELKTNSIISDNDNIAITATSISISATGENNLLVIDSTAGVSFTGDVEINGTLTSELISGNELNISASQIDIRSTLAPLTLNAEGENFFVVVGGHTLINATTVGDSKRLWLSGQVGFSSQGRFRLPWLTTTARNAIDTPEQGEIIFNTTTSKFQGYTGSAWVDLH